MKTNRAVTQSRGSHSSCRVAQQQGDSAAEASEVRKCLAVLETMERREMRFDRVMHQVYDQLVAMFRR